MTTPSTNITVAEPSLTAGEVEMLAFALDRSRAVFAWKTGGLGEAGLSHRHPPTTMTLGSLLKHVAFVEDWTRARLAGESPGAPWETVDWEAEPDYPWRTAADDSPATLYALWISAVERSRATIGALVADGGLDQPVRYGFEPDALPNARRLLVDLHDEYARHNGHADLIREAIDGLVGEDPPQA